MEDFILKNREFWSAFQAKSSNKKILIEESSIPMIDHANSIFLIILNQAKSLIPVWLSNRNTNRWLLQSYLPITKFIKINYFRTNIIKIFCISLWKFIDMYKSKDILSFSYDKVKYGDIVYDSFLRREKLATIRTINIKILRIVFTCILRHEFIKKILLKGDFEAVLVSHQVSIKSGVMLRVALRYGYKGYLRAGHHESTLQCFEGLEDIYNYMYKPFSKDVDNILIDLGLSINKIYESVLNKQVSGKGSKDAIYAFSSSNRYYKNRSSFVKDFKIDPKRKNVFVMLHAFNDHPHSHFRWMIFKDYYDWFIQTLEFTKNDKTVNWIFKQHPSIRFYPTKDVSFQSLFSKAPQNVIYLDEKTQIDTRSLKYCADLVVTCLGSAGVELPAMAGIPSVTAGDNFYANLGFAMEPRTKDEYFNILANAKHIKRLTHKQQMRARATYIYINKFSRVNVTACPITTLREEKDAGQNDWYWKKVIDLYNRKEEIIKDEISHYIKMVSQDDFKRLKSL